MAGNPTEVTLAVPFTARRMRPFTLFGWYLAAKIAITSVGIQLTGHWGAAFVFTLFGAALVAQYWWLQCWMWNLDWRDVHILTHQTHER